MKLTEAQFQIQVVQLAQLLKWHVAHFRPARVIVQGKETWRTPVSGNGAGFPDLCMARAGLVIFAELKTDRGKLSPLQMDWLDALGGPAAAKGSRHRCYVWRPRDWPEIERVLKAGF